MRASLAFVPLALLFALPLGHFEATALAAVVLAVVLLGPERTPKYVARPASSMRWMVALLLLAPLGSAAVLEDASGDVQVSAADNDLGSIPSGVKDSADLLSVDIEETPTELIFEVALVEMDGTGEEIVSDIFVEVWFQHGEKRYSIGYSKLVQGQDQAFLSEYDNGRANYYYVSQLDVEVDTTDDTLRLIVPRGLIPDHDGAPPVKGQSFTDIMAFARAPALVSQLVSVFPSLVTGDQFLVVAEDTAGLDAPGTYELQLGLPQDGTGRLTSERPYRVSNGEAGTFVYWVQASRAVEGTGTYTISTESIPQGWAVQVPTGELTISTAAPVTIPVVVQTAFAHAHGETETFVLTIIDEDKQKGRLEMGIRYPEIPQPAGHHNKLWLHSMPGNNVFSDALAPAHELAYGNDGASIAYMNALETDERNTGQAVDISYCGGTATTTKFCLEIPLNPELQMGLDWRVDEKGLLEIGVRAPIPLPGATVEGHIVKYTAEEEQFSPTFTIVRRVATTLATLETTDSFDLDSSTKQLEMQVNPLKVADYVPYDPLGSLSLHLNVTIDVPGIRFLFSETDPEPQLMPGGTLVLPLDEYKDSVQALPSFGKDLEWILERDERQANGGDVIVYQAVLKNNGPDDKFAIRLLGHNHEWSDMEPVEIKLKQNETHEVTVVVRVPNSAAEGATADLVLEAASVEDVSRRQLVQFRTLVVAEEVPDDAEILATLEPGDKKSPGLPLMFLVGALAIALRRLK